MKKLYQFEIFWKLMFVGLCVPLCAGAEPTSTSVGKSSQTITEDMLRPPPVPRFMLESSKNPLTIEEMKQQAREAQEKVKPPVSASDKHSDPSLQKPLQQAQ